MRLGGEASWWLHQTSQEQLLRYESDMNRAIPAEIAVLCLYDLNRFSSGVLIDVVQTHPRAVVNEMIIENPYYLEPEAYLTLLERRRRGLPEVPAQEEAMAFLDGMP